MNEKDRNGNTVPGPEYTSLVFYFNENSEDNVMRTRFYDNNQWYVVEQKITTSFNQTPVNDKYLWTLNGQNAIYIYPANSTEKYNSDHIVLSKGRLDQYYTPDYVYDDAGNYGKITSFKVLDKKDVTNDYLLAFEWKWQENNQKNKNNNNGNSNDVSGSTLYLILVTNSNDAALGDGFKANERQIKSLFTDVANSCGMNFNVTEIEGDNFNKQNVSSAINRLTPGGNDVIIFYYSGHGFRFQNQSSVWPQMDLRTGTNQDPGVNCLNLDADIYQPLSAKNARLLLVIGECCNTVPERTPYHFDPITMAPGANVMNSLAVKNLLAESGKVLIATCSPNESSWYYHVSGGYFWNSFMNCFMNVVSFTYTGSSVKWTDIFNDAIAQTTKLASEDEEYGQQHPLSHFELNE